MLLIEFEFWNIYVQSNEFSYDEPQGAGNGGEDNKAAETFIESIHIFTSSWFL